MPNILYLADPESIHDIKWMSFFSAKKDYNCFLIPRVHQSSSLSKEQSGHLKQYSIQLLDPIVDFSVLRFYRTIGGFLYIKKTVNKYNIDLIHVMYGDPNALWATGKKWLRLPMILTTRGTDILKAIPATFEKKSLINLIVSRLYKIALNKFDACTGTSKKQLSVIKSLTKSIDNLHLIRTGVDVEDILSDTSGSLPRELVDSKFLFFPRNMKPIYNHEFSIDALSLLPKKTKENFKMVFTDRDGGDRDYIDMIHNKMMADSDLSFVFLPRLSAESLYEVYKNASVVLMNPLSDGSPVSAIEAMICNTPVILGPLNYDKDLYHNFTYRLQNWNLHELKDLILLALSKEQSRDLNKIKENAKLKFDRKVEMKKVERLYEDALR